MTEKKLLWVFLIALIGVNVLLLVRNDRLSDLHQQDRSELRHRAEELRYNDEQQNLLLEVEHLPADFPKAEFGATGEGALDFYLIVSIEDCTNCIQDEVEALNALLEGEWGDRLSVQGYFVDDETPDAAEVILANLKPLPRFPVDIVNVLETLPGATTPLTLVVRARDGELLDAHKPIPEDLTRREAFYGRWQGVLGLAGAEEEARRGSR